MISLDDVGPRIRSQCGINFVPMYSCRKRLEGTEVGENVRFSLFHLDITVFSIEITQIL